MRYFSKHIRLFLFALFFLSWVILQAQKQDSLLEIATLSVYDKPEKAIEIADQLLKDFELSAHTKIQVYLILSNAYSSLRDYEKSLAYALQAKEVSATLKNPIAQYQVMIKIAAQYHSMGVNDRALQILDESDKIIESLPKTDSLRFSMGSNFAIRGFIYREQLSCDIAIDYLNRAYEAFSVDKESSRSLVNKSVASYNKGNCFITLNQLDSAKSNFKNAQTLAFKAGANSLQAFSMKGLAEVYTLEANYDKAIENLESAQGLAKDVGDLVLNRGIYKGLSDNYLALNDWSNFQKYDEEYILTNSQLKSSERSTINTVLASYGQEIKEKEKSLYTLYGIGILVGLILFILLLFWIVKGEMKFKKEINLLKSQIKF